jgi:hypothetical protein
MDIRSATIKYSKYKKHINQEHENLLEQKLNSLQQQLGNSAENELSDIQIEAISGELISISNEKTAGIILRSKVQWSEDGEKTPHSF